MPALASRTGLVSGEGAFEVLAQVKQLEARGRRVFNFAIGEPDFPTPQPIRQAAIAAIEAGHTRYSPSAGLWELREAVAHAAGRQRGTVFTPEQVVIAPGAKPLIYHSLFCCVEPGYEVLYPNPGFCTYETAIRMAGAVPVPYALREEDGFQVDPERLAALVGPRTRMLILNTPHNPTGSVLDREVLEAIARLARRHDLWVLVDEIYARIVFDGEFCSLACLPGMAQRLVLVDGFSKTYSMTGWRLGFGIMPAPLAEAVARMVTNVESCTATFTQLAGLAALQGSQEACARMVEEFRARREMVVQELNRVPGVRVRPPRGAFYAYANVTEACRRKGVRTADELARRLLEEAGVAVLPRSAFGSPLPGEQEQYVRLSFAASREQLHEGIGRFRAWMEEGGAP
ncbi:MAG TPA: pyridoxal phosphate-dependent aminotransferase [Limnochordales bacterium]